MGRTIRWLKSLFGIRKEKNQSNSGDRKSKIPSCIGRSHRDLPNSPSETPLVKPLYTNNSEEQNRRAIAVAAATVAVADAAVAAAQAAAAFVRLTTTDNQKNSAAIKIQALFRGYLSRKALKALKSLVKLQAVVRGYLVRKEAIETLQGMEALFRAQSRIFRLQDDKFHSNRSIKRTSEARSRRISSSFQTTINERHNLIEVDLGEPKSRLTRANTWAWASDASAQTPSPLFRNPCRLSVPNLSSHYEFDRHFLTTNTTPRFAYSCGPNGYRSIYDGLSKDDTFASHPGYMANTKSFRAKVRSQSAPKQRPTFGFGLKKRAGLSDVECGPIMVKSKSPSLLENSFKNCVMGRIGMSSKGQSE